jgi:hypothetical protein
MFMFLAIRYSKVLRASWKSILVFCSITFFCFNCFGQKGALEIIKIKEHTESSLKGLCTYQLFLKLDSSSTRALMVYGNTQHPLAIKSSKPFWNSAFGKAVGYGINPLYVRLDSNLVYDSWVTIESNGTCVGCPAVMNVESPDEKWIQAFEEGEDIIIQSPIGGAWFVTDKYVVHDNKILLGQFTTSGSIEVLLNVTLKDDTTGQKTDLTGLKCFTKRN